MSRKAGAREQALARLRELQELGETGLPRVPAPAAGARSRARAAAAEPPAQRREAAAATSPKGLEAPVAAALPIVAASSAESAAAVAGLDLAGMREALADCRRCKLCRERTQVVFGVGAPAARLMFVGEGPGADEDAQGEPFVGRAGQLLTDMIEKGMGLRRADVYIANVVKCRPPGNRNPEPDEIAACSPFLERQVALVRPEVIVALGKFAAQTLLKSDAPIGRLRGRWHEYQGTPLMPTFHPAYLLRSPGEKRLAWEDLKLVMAKLGLAPPSR